MRLTQQELNRYRREVDDAALMAHDYFEFAIRAYEEEHPNASTAEERQFVVELIRTALPNFTEVGATISCDFFDEMREALEWPEDVSSEMYDMTDYDIVERKIHYFAEHLANGNRQAFVDDVTDVTAYMVKRSAFENMQQNCRKQKIKYARVPTGFETCGFCFMLASRGFDYRSEESASKAHRTGDAYHPNCDCIIVPGFQDEDGNPRVKIDGYDPETMYENWCACSKTVGVDPRRKMAAWTDEERDAVMREVETRDRHWLHTGEKPKVTFENDELEKEIRGKRPQELETALRLREHGLPLRFQVDEYSYFDEKKGVWQTIGLSDLQSGYELKTLSDAGWNSVDGYLRKTAKKEGVKAIVIDNSGNKSGLTDASLIEKLQSQRRWNGPIYVLTQNGDYIRVPKNNASGGPLRVQPGRKDSIAQNAGKKKVVTSTNSPLSIDSKQFGYKVGEHANHFGLEREDLGDVKVRTALVDRFNDIIQNKEEKLKTPWPGQDGMCTAYVKGGFVVLLDKNGGFVSAFKEMAGGDPRLNKARDEVSRS